MTTIATPAHRTIGHHKTPPAWVNTLLGGAPPRTAPIAGTAAELAVREHGRICLASAVLPRATALPTAQFSQTVQRIYDAIARSLAQRGIVHPIRFWNHIPDIHADMGAGLDRYMAFNLGRYQALRQWLGSEQAFPTSMATASGIGCGGDTLVVHALASDRSGLAIENSRQVPAYRYSSRYGPRPPCFARATAWTDDSGRPMLLIGGTASVRGEDSVHRGDLPAQLEETCANLQALIGSAAAATGQAWNASSMRSLRAYLPDGRVAQEVERALLTVFPAVRQVELVSAQLCRRDLLVEVEGVAG